VDFRTALRQQGLLRGDASRLDLRARCGRRGARRSWLLAIGRGRSFDRTASCWGAKSDPRHLKIFARRAYTATLPLRYIDAGGPRMCTPIKYGSQPGDGSTRSGRRSGKHRRRWRHREAVRRFRSTMRRKDGSHAIPASKDDEDQVPRHHGESRSQMEKGCSRPTGPTPGEDMDEGRAVVPSFWFGKMPLVRGELEWQPSLIWFGGTKHGAGPTARRAQPRCASVKLLSSRERKSGPTCGRSAGVA